MSIGGGGGYINVDSAGSVPLANPVAGGASGIVTGTEREKLQGVGTVVESVYTVVGGVLLGVGWSSPAGAPAVTLGAGTWEVECWAHFANTGGSAVPAGVRHSALTTRATEVQIPVGLAQSIHHHKTTVVGPATVTEQFYAAIATVLRLYDATFNSNIAGATGIRAVRVA
jgi:hypothetical protein